MAEPEWKIRWQVTASITGPSVEPGERIFYGLGDSPAAAWDDMKAGIVSRAERAERQAAIVRSAAELRAASFGDLAE